MGAAAKSSVDCAAAAEDIGEAFLGGEGVDCRIVRVREVEAVLRLHVAGIEDEYQVIRF